MNIHITSFCGRGQRIKKILVLGFIFQLFFNLNTKSQGITEAYKKEIDSLLIHHTINTPGYAIGVIQNGELIYSKGYGAANLEYGISITDTSAFYIGSLSKQFTAACIWYLENQAKISLDDNIRKYIPEMPRYDKTITIRHLLHHTSGIREWSSLVLFQGFNTTFEDFLDNKTLLKLICRQKELNFEPGTQYKYSSSGYILLAEVIERITGKTLRTFADEILFKPLGMYHTFFSNAHAEIVKNRVESYRGTSNGYEKLLKGFEVYGDGGIITTVQDLAKWDQAFYSDVLGIPNFAAKMYQQGTLNNGRKINYASALIAGKYKGLTYYQHQGGMIQFDAYMIRYPAQRCTIIVLSNSWSNPYSGYRAEQITDIILKDQFKSVQEKLPRVKSFPVKSAELKQLAGHYWNMEDNYYNLIIFRNDSLFFDNTEGFQQYLIPVDKNKFRMKDYESYISFKTEDQQTMMYYSDESFNNPLLIFEKYSPQPPQALKDLEPYLGVYYSDELEAYYRFHISDGKFFLRINNNMPKELFPDPGIRWNSKTKVWIGFAEITFSSEEGKVNGLTIGDSRVSSIRFEKTD